jgi:hypothetical protein
VALRIFPMMRWLVLTFALAGCGAPPAEEHPFLVLRQDHVQTQESPDAGGPGLQPVPAADDPGQPVE